MHTPIQGDGSPICMRFGYHEPVSEKRELDGIEIIFSSRNNYRQTGKEVKLIPDFPHIFKFNFHIISL